MILQELTPIIPLNVSKLSGKRTVTGQNSGELYINKAS